MNPRKVFLLFTFLLVPFISISLVKADNPPQQVESAQTSSERLEEAAIMQMMTDIEQIVEKKDVAGLLNYFTPFTYSEVTRNSDYVSETLKITGISEHQAYFTELWQKVQSTEELFNDYQIQLASDEQSAIVRRVRLLNVTLTDGKTYIVSSQAKARIAKINGELKIIALEEMADVGIRP